MKKIIFILFFISIFFNQGFCGTWSGGAWDIKTGNVANGSSASLTNLTINNTISTPASTILVVDPKTSLPSTGVTQFGNFNGLNFDGTSGNVTIANNATGNQINGSTAYSVETWAFIRSDGESDLGYIFDKTASTSGTLWGSSQSGSNVQLNFRIPRFTTNAQSNTSVSVPINTWVHIIGSFDLSNPPYIFINGAEATYSGTPALGGGALRDDTAGVLLFGNKLSDDRAYDGLIRTFRIYRNKAINASEAALAYNGTRPSGCTAEYLFKEGTGSTLVDTISNNNGTINGATWVNTSQISNDGLNWNFTKGFGKVLIATSNDTSIGMQDYNEPANNASWIATKVDGVEVTNSSKTGSVILPPIIKSSSATTNTVTIAELINGTSTGLPAAGMGRSINWNLTNATNVTQNVGSIASLWESASTNNASITFSTMNAATLAEKMRIDNLGNVGIGNTTPAYKLDVNGTASFGTVANTTTIEADGTLLFNGVATVWNDVFIPLTLAKQTPAGKPDFEIFKNGTYAYSFVSGESMYFAQELPHDYKLGTNLQPHIHWAPSTTNTSPVIWQLEYTLANMTIGVFSNTVQINATQAGSGTALTHQFLNFPEIAVPSLYIGSVIVGNITRIDSGAGANFTGEAFGLSVGFHYEVDTMGSRTNITK